MPTYVLGINSAYHESAACLLEDGVVVAAAEEERFSRRKHAKAARLDNPHELPEAAIAWCLAEAGIALADVDHAGYSLLPEVRRRNSGFGEPVVAGSWGSEAGEETFYRHVHKAPAELARLGFLGRFEWLSHHRCHAAAAFFTAPVEEAAVLTVDGIAETSTAYLGHGRGRRIDDLAEIEYPHSIGFLWEKLSSFLGFSEYDACKVMGLAAYGSPDRFGPAFAELCALRPDGTFTLRGDILRFRAEDDRPLAAFLKLKPRKRGEELRPEHADLAAALQAITDKVVLHLANDLHRRTGAKDLCVGGGVALNCVTNQRLSLDTPFRHVYIHPAAHDAGTALGAAFILWHEHLGGPRREQPHTAYLGPQFDEAAMKAALDAAGCEYRRVDAIEEEVAERLAAGRIVAHFHGRMEWGPRALGNRSLLADPRRAEMREVLNHKVKHREPFRPFAPSVLAEAAGDWFDIPDGAFGAEFMLVACPAWQHVAGRIPAVVHVDGSCRVQTVVRERNPRYHAIISAFGRRTGVPVVLNTSFNDDEPIVCSPADAIATFRKTAIDDLALGPFLVSRG